VTVPIILNQAVGYCFHYFESGCKITGTVINILIQNNRNNDQQTDKKMETVANILIQNNVNIHQQPDPKSPEQ
jgi:hypothetical protein